MSTPKKISVHAYKWNGWLYRAWEFPRVLKETEDYICVSSENCKVITSEENSDRFFHSKIDRPTIWYFFKKEWFNLIIAKKNDKFFYYINVASPYIIEDNDVLKYIDFDLDFYVGDTKTNIIKELDFNEFMENRKKYNYSPKLLAKIEVTRKQIELDLRNKAFDKYFEKSPLSRQNKPFIMNKTKNE